jgi:AcrR family transcriptional regulator
VGIVHFDVDIVHTFGHDLAMGRKPANRYHHGDLRRALVDEALTLLRKRSAAELSLREVARSAGVTANAPYRHFPDKQALLAAVAEEGFRILRQACQAAKGSGETRVTAMGKAYLQFARSHPHLYRVMFGNDLRDWQAYESLCATADSTFAVLVEAVASAYRLDAGRATTEAVVNWATVHGYAMLEIDGALQGCPATRLPTPLELTRRPRGE